MSCSLAAIERFFFFFFFFFFLRLCTPLLECYCLVTIDTWAIEDLKSLFTGLCYSQADQSSQYPGVCVCEGGINRSHDEQHTISCSTVYCNTRNKHPDHKYSLCTCALKHFLGSQHCALMLVLNEALAFLFISSR